MDPRRNFARSQWPTHYFRASSIIYACLKPLLSSNKVAKYQKTCYPQQFCLGGTPGSSLKQFLQCRFNLRAIKIVKKFLGDAPQDPARLTIDISINCN